MVKCSVVGCDNKTYEKRPGISFHGFPKNYKLRLRWLNAINRPEYKPTKASKVCSLHFDGNDINYTLNRQRLKDDACPFLHIPNLRPGQQAEQLLQEFKSNDIVLPSTSQSGTPTAQLHKSNLNLFPEVNYDDVPQTTIQNKSLGICKTAESEQNELRKLRKQNMILRKKLKMLHQKTRRQKKKIISLKSLYNDLVKKTNDERQILKHQGDWSE